MKIQLLLETLLYGKICFLIQFCVLMSLAVWQTTKWSVRSIQSGIVLRKVVLMPPDSSAWRCLVLLLNIKKNMSVYTGLCFCGDKFSFFFSITKKPVSFTTLSGLQQRSEGGANGSVAPFFLRIENFLVILRLRKIQFYATNMFNVLQDKAHSKGT